METHHGCGPCQGRLHIRSALPRGPHDAHCGDRRRAGIGFCRSGLLGEPKLCWRHDSGGLSQPSPHRALKTAEISGIVEQYRIAAVIAKRRGFDGVEAMADNGQLIDQFLQDSSNKVTDRYGGSIENRTRLLVEVVEALNRRLGRRPDRGRASRQAGRTTTWPTAIPARYSVTLQSGSTPTGWPICMASSLESKVAKRCRRPSSGRSPGFEEDLPGSDHRCRRLHP